MNSTIETLRNTIDTLTEEEAVEVLQAVEQIKQRVAFLNRFKNQKSPCRRWTRSRIRFNAT